MWRELKEANKLQTEQIKEVNSRYPSVKKETYTGIFVWFAAFVSYILLDIAILKTSMFWMDITMSVFLAALFVWIGHLHSKYQGFYNEIAEILKRPKFKSWHFYLGAVIVMIVGVIWAYIDIMLGC